MWVETVVYTLIGLAVIGLLLAVSRPKIEEIKDKILIEQTIESMNSIDAEIQKVQVSPGNRRVPNLKISKGRFIINATGEKIYWIINSEYKYSEFGEEINLGNLKIVTEEASPFIVTLTLNYDNFDLLYDGGSIEKEIDSTPLPYAFSIENMGSVDGKIQINLKAE